MMVMMMMVMMMNDDGGDDGLKQNIGIPRCAAGWGTVQIAPECSAQWELVPRIQTRFTRSTTGNNHTVRYVRRLC